MQRHVVRPLILGLAAAFLVAVGPTAAKIPFFSVEVSPPDPAEGEVVLVTVRMWDDPSHTQPSTWSEPVIADLLEFQGDTGRISITLHQMDDATYRAEVTLAAGSWRLVAFPMGVARSVVPAEGYPTPVRVTVSERWDLSAGAVAAVAGALGIVGLLVGRQVRRGIRQRRLGSATG